MYLLEQLSLAFGSLLGMFVFIILVIITILAFFVPIFIFQIRNYVKDIKETQEKILNRLPK
jgi:predicted PurR-regulated permease PerM